MKFTRHNMINVGIALAAALLFGGFLALALPGENRDDDQLDAVAETTTTTEAQAPTSIIPTTTSTTLSLGTSTTARSTATTARTTATTRRGTTNTTQTPATTVAGPSGRVNEKSDNSASFTHNQDGSFSASATDPPGGSDPFRFTIRTAPGSGGVSGDTASVKFTVTLTNNTSKTVSFPGGLKVTVTMRAPNGSDITFTMTASDVTNITPGETITITQERGVSGYGTFDATASCDVDYG